MPAGSRPLLGASKRNNLLQLFQLLMQTLREGRLEEEGRTLQLQLLCRGVQNALKHDGAQKNCRRPNYATMEVGQKKRSPKNVKTLHLPNSKGTVWECNICSNYPSSIFMYIYIYLCVYIFMPLFPDFFYRSAWPLWRWHPSPKEGRETNSATRTGDVIS